MAESPFALGTHVIELVLTLTAHLAARASGIKFKLFVGQVATAILADHTR